MQQAVRKEEKKHLAIPETYLALVKNSVGSKFFRNLYVLEGRRKLDVLQNGNLSCAVHVSSILYLLGLLDSLHTTVSGTVKDMDRNGWRKIERPQKGAILIWEKKMGNDGLHNHIGFYMGGTQAISNIDRKGMPAMHHFTFGISRGEPVRGIEEIYWHPRLMPSQ